MKPYYPSNGTEGLSFIEAFCVNCKRDPMSRDINAKTGCAILAKSMGESKGAKQWVYNENGCPTCTSFVHYKEHKGPKKKRKIKGQMELFV